MKRLVGVIVCGMTVLLCSTMSARAEEPSVKKGLEEVGEAVKDDAKAAAHKTGEVVEKGVHATERGVGGALEKTGEKVEGAGKKVREKGE